MIEEIMIQSNILALLALTFTLEYLTIGVPNFAHATIAFVSAYVALAIYLLGINVYIVLPIAFLASSFLNFSIYKLLSFLRRQKVSLVGLMISTLAIDMIIYSLMNIFADYLAYVLKAYTRSFTLRVADFTFGGLPGVIYVSSIICFGSIIGWYFLLTKTKFGVSMRAIVENYRLAKTLGINTESVLGSAWFLIGGFIGLSGAIYPLWFSMNPWAGADMIVRILAASILGGLSNVYAAWVGGFLVGGIESLGIYYISSLIGSWFTPFRLLIPASVVFLTLGLMPEGIAGLIEKLRWR